MNGHQLGEREFLVGLTPGPAKDLVGADYGSFSIFAAEQPPSVWNRHTHGCTQITVALTPAKVRAEWLGGLGRNESRELNGDMAWIVPPGVPHVIDFNRRAHLIHLYLTDDFFQAMVEGAPQRIESDLQPALLVRDPLLIEMARGLFRESRAGHFSKLYTQSIATVTATHLLRTYSRGHAPQEFRGGLGATRERRLLAYMQEHLSHDLSLDDLALVAGISPNYLISLFRKSFGVTPHRYILRLRVERAQQLLHASRELSLLEIAMRCGFTDQSQFSKTFRRVSGIAPGQYRRSHTL